MSTVVPQMTATPLQAHAASSVVKLPHKYNFELEAFMSKLQTLKLQAPPPPIHDVAGRRRLVKSFVSELRAMPLEPAVQKQWFRTTTEDSHELDMVWYSPSTSTGAPRPAILHAHGGGMIAFDVGSFDVMLNNLVAVSGIPLLSIDYRLAPEHPFPIPLNDYHTGLNWLRDHATSLNIDTSRIGVMGESAGGCLAAALALLDRDRNGSPALAKQILVYPMLDDRKVKCNHGLLPYVTHTWEDNVTNWCAYLGRDIADTALVSKYAAPARETCLSNLPPAYIEVGDLDIFLDEDIDYAQRLMACNVKTEFMLCRGAPHGFQLLIPQAEISKRAMRNRANAMKSF